MDILQSFLPQLFAHCSLTGLCKAGAASWLPNRYFFCFIIPRCHSLYPQGNFCWSAPRTSLIAVCRTPARLCSAKATAARKLLTYPCWRYLRTNLPFLLLTNLCWQLVLRPFNTAWAWATDWKICTRTSISPGNEHYH